MNIVLTHGILGFREKFGVEYFNGVREHLQKYPAKVFVAEVDPTGGIVERGESLRAQIIAAFADGTLDAAERAHLIAHSMGGLDSRYILSPGNPNTTPQNDISARIASLTTVASPHRGSPVADLIDLQPDAGSATAAYLRAIVDHLGALDKIILQLLYDFGISLQGLKDLTTDSTRTFNEQYPDHPDVRYFSVAGKGRAGALPTALVLFPFHKHIESLTGQANDGLVAVGSAQWGEFDPDAWPCDHAEEIGHDLDHPLEPARFDYLARYDQIVKRAST